MIIDHQNREEGHIINKQLFFDAHIINLQSDDTLVFSLIEVNA